MATGKFRFIGKTVTGSQTKTLTTNADTTILSVTLDEGTWIVFGHVAQSTPNQVNCNARLINVDIEMPGLNNTGSGCKAFAIGYVVVSSSKTITLQSYGYNSSYLSVTGKVIAVRVH